VRRYRDPVERTPPKPRLFVFHCGLMTHKDIKLLWGRSGNRCAICRIELSQEPLGSNSAFTLGEQAHIVGESNEAARGNSLLTPEERETYHNRILLCPNHHTEIDKNEAAFPVEKLHYLKSVHELWVRETLADSSDSKVLAQQVAVTTIIDAAVEMCRLKEWKEWTSFALAAEPSWDGQFPDTIWKFRHMVEAAIWPDGFEELMRATITFSILLHRAARKFLKHAKKEDGTYYADKFYKANAFNPHYDRDLSRYQTWNEECTELVVGATRAANWFADVVRRDINPMFFAAVGRFVIIEGPISPDFSFQFYIPQFSEEQKRLLPASLRMKDENGSE
jgi:hypothetical protein